MVIKGSTPNPAISADGTEPLTPEQIVEHLRTLRPHIPEFGPLPVSDAQSLRRAAHVADDLVQAATNTVGASPLVATAIGKSADVLRIDREDVSRWSNVEHELETMLKGVAAANLGRRYRLGLAALQTYSITRQLVRQSENADLLPHVEAMRRVNTFGRRRRVPAPAAVVAAPPKV
ncbi:MAG: hypothetical protein QOH21_3441 [Acidobacteriota bacterium]|jgi:hypothetical protein|nr:hypothetical protein [Acidobacteriota bacterium]